MIEAAGIETGQSPQKAAQQNAREPQPVGFSFAFALSALEGRAAQSLETYGGAPKAAPAIGQPNGELEIGKQSEAHAKAPVEAKADKPAPGALETINLKPAQNDAQKLVAQSPTQTTPQAPTTTPQHIPLAALPAIAQQAPGAVRTETAALRATDATSAQTTRKALAPAPTRQAPAATQEFAKLVAQRLNAGETNFELRLSPQELGRIEANLKVADDGEALLALKFENQTTLDLFARDEAALRSMLLSSGFDLGGERLAFSLAEEAEAAASETSSSIVAQDAYDAAPRFIAPYSSGAVDLKV